MKLAIIMNLAPRKLGSFEGWITAMCERARARGHAVDVYGRAPLHPEFHRRLTQLGCGWVQVETLERAPYEAIRRLSSYDVLHLNMFAPRSKMALLAYAAVPAKVMFVDHTSGPVPTAVKKDPPVVSLLKSAADTVTMLRVEGIAGVSEYVSERNRRRFKLKADRVRTIYNGIDLARFVSREEFFDLEPKQADGSPRPLTVAAVAHLIPQKGIDFLVRGVGLAKDRSLRLRIVGDGAQLGQLQRMASELGIADRVEFLGLRDDVNQIVGAADIFVHPAIWEEAFGLTIAEAMAAGRAVVATRIGGIPELVEHGVSGLLVTPQSAEEIAAALDLLASNGGLRRQLGENARFKARKAFSLSSCADEHVNWCEGALKGKDRRPSRPLEAGPPALR